MSTELVLWRMFVTAAIILFLSLLLRQKNKIEELSREVKILKKLIIATHQVNTEIGNILKSDGTKGS